VRAVRPSSLLVCALAAAALAGCGRDRLATPDLDRPAEPGPAARATFPKAGLVFERPSAWTFEPGTDPLVARGSSGTAVVAVWRYPRTEPLPRERAALEDAQGTLEDALSTRDTTFALESSRITKVDGAPAIEILGTQTIAEQRRKVRSLHAYAKGAEVVVDTYAAEQDFGAMDRAVFRPLMRSLKIDPPQP
jgi:hypothetical protein